MLKKAAVLTGQGEVIRARVLNEHVKVTSAVALPEQDEVAKDIPITEQGYGC